MAIMIREYIGHNCSNTKESYSKRVNISESYKHTTGPLSKNSIIQIIEGIHVGKTRNYTEYMPEALEGSQESWLYPYKRPLIMHHNERDGKIIGRILDVDYVTKNTRSNTPALRFTCNISDKEGIEQVEDGRLTTTSIGIIAHDVRCSICGEQIDFDEEGMVKCGHEKGNQYDEEICYWQVYKMEAKELSYVIVPSDVYAHNLETLSVEDYLKKNNKSFSENLKKEGAINLSESAKKAIEEGKVKDATIEDDGTKKVEDNATVVENKDLENKTLDELITIIRNLEKEKKDCEARANEIKQKFDEISKTLGTKEKELEDKEKEASTAKVKLDEEIKLREAAENELVSIKVNLREANEKEFNMLRTQLGRPIMTAESLSKRSNESLLDAICDLQEELKAASNLTKITEAADPTIQNNDDENNKNNKNNKPINVKEGNSVSNNNEEDLSMDELIMQFTGASFF